MDQGKGRLRALGSASAAVEAQFKKMMAQWNEPDPARISTSMVRFEKEADKVFKPGGSFEHLISNAIPFLDEVKPEEFVASMGSRARTKQSKDLVAYFRALDAQYPMASGLLIRPVVGDRRFAQALRQGLAYLMIASRRRREHRSEAMRHSLQVLIEVPYYMFVEVLYRAECLKRGKMMNAQRGGRQLHLLDAWLPPGLVVPDANRYRNAAAHASWRYVPSSDAIELAHGSRVDVVPNRDMYRLGIRMLGDIGGLFEALVVTSECVMRLMVEAGALDAIKHKDSARFDESVLMRSPLHMTYQTLQRLGMPAD